MSGPTAGVDDAQSSTRSKLLAAGAGVGLAVAGFLVLVAGSLAPALVYGLEYIQTTAGLVAGTVAGQALLLLAAVGYLRWRPGSVSAGVPSRDESGLIGAVVAVSVAAAFVLDVVVRRVVSGELSNVLYELIRSDPSIALVFGALSVVLIAPAEELFFRGAIQGRLRDDFDAVPSILGASLVFGAYHLANFSGSVLGAVLGALVIGGISLLWGYAYERTGNVAVPILVHGLYNLTLLLVAYVRL